MTTNVYRKLRKHLDDLPGGFPATETGVELRILKRLFTPEEAQLATHLTLLPEEPRVVARRAKISKGETAIRLEEMARKGLLFRVEEVPGKQAYMAAQYVIGIWEFHVNALDPELIKDMDEYKPHVFKTAWKRPQLRTICATTCPSGALTLNRKPETVQAKVPKNAIAAAISHGQARGKLGMPELLKMQAKSKWDRFLAPNEDDFRISRRF